MRNLAVEVNYVWRKYDHFIWTDRINWDFEPTSVSTSRRRQIAGRRQAARRSPTIAPTSAAAVAVRVYQRAGSVPRLQRRRVRAEQALLGSLGGQRQLRLEQRDRSLGFDRRHRGPEQHREPQRRVVTRRRLRAPASTTSSTTPSGSSRRAASTRLPLVGNQHRRQRQRDPGLSVPAADRDHQPRQRWSATPRLLFPLGDVRLPNLFVADFRVDKAFNFGGMRIIPSMDIFNLTNSSEILSRRRTQYSYNATTRRGLLLDDAAAEQHQQHHRAARHPLRAGSSGKKCNAEC